MCDRYILFTFTFRLWISSPSYVFIYKFSKQLIILKPILKLSVHYFIFILMRFCHPLWKTLTQLQNIIDLKCKAKWKIVSKYRRESNIKQLGIIDIAQRKWYQIKKKKNCDKKWNIPLQFHRKIKPPVALRESHNGDRILGINLNLIWVSFSVMNVK